MSDIQALQASIGADVAQFLTGMQQAAAMVAQLAQAQQIAAQASQEHSAEATAAADAARQQAQAAKEAAAAYNSDWSDALKENTARQKEATDAAKEARENTQKLYDLLGVSVGFEAGKKVVDTLKEIALETINAAASAQMIGVRFQSAFGVASDGVAEWAETAGALLGRSRDDMMQAATAAKVMAEGLGMSSEASTDAAEGLTKMAVQMSIARGISLDDAIQRLNTGLHGMGRGLYEFGIALNATTQSQEAQKEGFTESYAQLTEAQQAQVNYNIIMAQSGKLADDAAAASGTYANQVVSLKSSWEEMTAHLGGAALPALTSIVEIINSGVKAFDSLKDSTKGWILSLAMGPVGVATKMIQDLYSNAKKVLDLAGGGKDPGEVQRQAMYAQAQQQQAQNDEDKRRYDELIAEGEAARAKREADDEKAAEDLKKVSDEVDKARLEAWRQAQKVQQEMAQISAEADKRKQEAAAAELKGAVDAATARVDAATQAAKIQQEADQNAIKNAQTGANAAEQHLKDAQSNGTFSDVQSAQAAVDAAYSKVQAAQVQAVQDLQGQIDANNQQLNNLSIVGDQQEAQKEIERIKKENADLLRKIVDDETALEDLKRQNMDRARAELAAYQAGAGLGSLGAQAANASQFGKLANDTAAGLKSGGAAGGLAAAGYDLLSQSSQFKAFVAQVDAIFADLSNAIGSGLGPLVPVITEIGTILHPIIEILGQIFAEFGNILASVAMPFLKSIAELVQPIANLLLAVTPLLQPLIELASIFEILVNLFDPIVITIEILGGIFRMFSGAIQSFTDGVQKVVSDIAGFWNGLIQWFDSILHDMDTLPVIGGYMDTLGQSLEGLLINTNGTATAMNSAAQAAQGFASSLMSVNQATAQLNQARQKEQADEQALAYAQAHGMSQAVIDALQKQVQQDQQSVNQANYAVQESYDAGNPAKLLQDMADASLSAAMATQDNTKAVQALTQVLANTPTGFNLGAYTSGSPGGGTTVVVVQGNGSPLDQTMANLRKITGKLGRGTGGQFR